MLPIERRLQRCDIVFELVTVVELQSPAVLGKNPGRCPPRPMVVIVGEKKRHGAVEHVFFLSEDEGYVAVYVRGLFPPGAVDRSRSIQPHTYMADKERDRSIAVTGAGEQRQRRPTHE